MVILMRLPPLCAAVLLLCSSALPATAGWDEGLAAWQRKDWGNAAKEFQPLAQNGHVGALNRLGQMTLNGQGIAKNEPEALRLLLAAAEKGDASAQNAVGSLYFKGIGTDRNVAQAIIWFGRSADQGYARAQNNLGQLYLLGNGVAKDEAKALGLLRSAADKGIAASWEALGMAYWDGRGVTADHAESVRWYRKAAEQGMLLSQNRLGSALWNGDGVAKDASEAAKWFELAATQGDGSSLYNMSIAYLHGMGVAKDSEKAAFYAILAARFAKPADKNRFEEARNKARERISDEHWARAEAKASNWTPKATAPDSEAAVANKSDPSPSAPPRPQFSAGSGIVVGSDGVVLTYSHVVERCRNIRVSLEGVPAQAATVVARDAGNDLAALKASFRPTEIARFREDKPLRSGDGVVVIGYPLSSLLSREPNVTAGVISALAGLKGDKRSYQITAPVQKGNSGGPLADMSGNVVGIVSAKLNAMKIADSTGDLPQNVNFAIKSELARKFLTDNGLSFDTAPAATTLSPADVGEIVKKVTVFVECEG
ncbi:MAG: trypsin-like peptidase domain-containing protein [Magnetospirillum sp.]|nr:trypsin-like peptidase domain-containing protein [Magnetospirillum sp.]